MKLGLQLYSIGDETYKDFDAAIEKVAKIGYDGVEFAGYGGKTAKELKKLIADNGLEIASSHTDIPEKDEDFKPTLEYAAEAGIPFLVCAGKSYPFWFPEDHFQRSMEHVNRYTELAATYGIQIGFHNHYMEFMESKGKQMMEKLYEATLPNFVLEIDCYWAEYADQNALETIKRFKDKATTLCHYKQMAKDSKDNVTLDQGKIDFKAISDYLKANGAKWAIIEQEGIAIPSIEAAKINHDFARTVL